MLAIAIYRRPSLANPFLFFWRLLAFDFRWASYCDFLLFPTYIVSVRAGVSVCSHLKERRKGKPKS